MCLLPPSFGGSGGFVSRVGTQRVTHCTPVQRVQSVIDTQLQTMKVFKLLVKIFFLETVITTATMSGRITNNNVKYNSLVFCLQKHPINSNGNIIPTPKYKNLFTTNAKIEVKAIVLTLIDEWILNEVQMACDHGAGSSKARAMKGLVKMDKSYDSNLPLKLQNSIGIWSTIIYNALNHKKVLLTAATMILATCGGCGYIFLCIVSPKFKN